MAGTRDWSKIMAKWVAARKKEGEPLRKAVWREMEPLRRALTGTNHPQ